MKVVIILQDAEDGTSTLEIEGSDFEGPLLTSAEEYALIALQAIQARAEGPASPIH